MKARTRLQIWTMTAAAVIAVVGGWAISRNGNNDDTVVLESQNTFDQPGIGTNAPVEGTALPDSTVQNLQGDDIAISSLVGHPMVINIWGSTCGPCKKELPAFAAAHLQYGDTVRFVGIDYLPASDREEAFARDKGVQYELLYDGNGEFVNDVGVAAFPVTLFVNADGRIIRQTGQLDEAQLVAFIESDLL